MPLPSVTHTHTPKHSLLVPHTFHLPHTYQFSLTPPDKRHVHHLQRSRTGATGSAPQEALSHPESPLCSAEGDVTAPSLPAFHATALKRQLNVGGERRMFQCSSSCSSYPSTSTTITLLAPAKTEIRLKTQTHFSFLFLYPEFVRYPEQEYSLQEIFFSDFFPYAKGAKTELVA